MMSPHCATCYPRIFFFKESISAFFFLNLQTEFKSLKRRNHFFPFSLGLREAALCLGPQKLLLEQTLPIMYYASEALLPQPFSNSALLVCPPPPVVLILINSGSSHEHGQLTGKALLSFSWGLTFASPHSFVFCTLNILSVPLCPVVS